MRCDSIAHNEFQKIIIHGVPLLQAHESPFSPYDASIYFEPRLPGKHSSCKHNACSASDAYLTRPAAYDSHVLHRSTHKCSDGMFY